eukprot:5851319-Pleurochrysis_carterae.AAC.1
MEDFEHGNKVTKQSYLRRTSAGGVLNKFGFRRHHQAQALQQRREGTIAAHELGMINLHSSLQKFLKPNRVYARKFDVQEVKKEPALKREALFAGAKECGDCSAAATTADTSVDTSADTSNADTSA